MSKREGVEHYILIGLTTVQEGCLKKFAGKPGCCRLTLGGDKKEKASGSILPGGAGIPRLFGLSKERGEAGL